MHEISIVFDEIKETITHAQEKHKQAANNHRRSLAFTKNDWVLLRFTKARLFHTTRHEQARRTHGSSKVLYEAC